MGPPERIRQNIPTVPAGAAAADRDIAKLPGGLDGNLYDRGISDLLPLDLAHIDIHGNFEGAVGRGRNEGLDSVYKAVVGRQIP